MYKTANRGGSGSICHNHLFENVFPTENTNAMVVQFDRGNVIAELNSTGATVREYIYLREAVT